MFQRSDDLDCNTSANTHFREVLEKGLASPGRRKLLRGGVGLGAVAGLPMLNACSDSDEGVPQLAAPSTPLGFAATPKSLADQVTVPSGYTVRVIHATGDPINDSTPPYSNAGVETDDWSTRIGDHHDGMDIYYINASGKYSRTATNRAVLAVNHESSADAHFFHLKGQTSGGVNGKKFDQFGSWDTRDRPADGLESLKEINHHGVSVVELSLDASGRPTGYIRSSALNRRVTAQTPIRVAGPAAHLANIRSFMVTRYDPTGAMVRGTLNNCGHGITPWGTYLGCEENWAVYFQIARGGKAADAKLTTSRARYGVRSAVLAADATTSTGQGWYTVSATDDRFARWNISADGATASSDFRNEPNTFGYNVEIDPLDPTAMPAKRVAMGRFAHEGAWCSIPVEGRPLAFYMGCDSRNEYIYKFVSAANWSASDIGGGMAAGNKYLDEGKLYVARFNSDGTGDWLELTISNPAIQGYTAYSFANQADVYVNARLAADAVGATKMDRPEWGAVNPANGDVYFTLTNNNATNRTPTSTNAANPRSYADPDGNKGSGNPNGHIIRFAEDGGLATATKFRWDIFLFGSEEDHPSTVNLSKLTASNALSSPDGLWFSPANGILWIETDDGAYTDETNCMLLAALPGKVGDGASIVVDNELSGARAQQQTFIGALLGEARLRRFLVGPKGSEITGVTETPDGRALLVNIQHPGENTLAVGTAASFNFQSQWPGNGLGVSAGAYGPAGRPRSATIVITRTDGGRIGL